LWHSFQAAHRGNESSSRYNGPIAGGKAAPRRRRLGNARRLRRSTEHYLRQRPQPDHVANVSSRL